MADYGLEIYGPSGERWMDVTDRLAHIIGRKWITSSGSLTHPKLAEGTPFYVLVTALNDPSNDGGYTITFSGNRMSWSVDSGYSGINIIYGAY